VEETEGVEVSLGVGVSELDGVEDVV